jgi:hypothetical protein
MAEEGRTAGDLPLPGGDFRLFVQKLGYQALLGLGVLENPLTRTKDVNLPHARSVIDDIAMLREKTAGNLASEEDEHLATVIADLERHYARVSSGGDPETS